MSRTSLLEDTFAVQSLNDNGKKFERVNRLHCKGTTYDVDLVLDVNAELFPVQSGKKIEVLLSTSLDNGTDDGHYNPGATSSPLMDRYDYIMHGRVFSIKHIEHQRVEVQASFGGLLLRLRGEQGQMECFTVDMTFYILARIQG